VARRREGEETPPADGHDGKEVYEVPLVLSGGPSHPRDPFDPWPRKPGCAHPAQPRRCKPSMPHTRLSWSAATLPRRADRSGSLGTATRPRRAKVEKE